MTAIAYFALSGSTGGGAIMYVPTKSDSEARGAAMAEQVTSKETHTFRNSMILLVIGALVTWVAGFFAVESVRVSACRNAVTGRALSIFCPDEYRQISAQQATDTFSQYIAMAADVQANTLAWSMMDSTAQKEIGGNQDIWTKTWHQYFWAELEGSATPVRGFNTFQFVVRYYKKGPEGQSLNGHIVSKTAEFQLEKQDDGSIVLHRQIGGQEQLGDAISRPYLRLKLTTPEDTYTLPRHSSGVELQPGDTDRVGGNLTALCQIQVKVVPSKNGAATDIGWWLRVPQGFILGTSLANSDSDGQIPGVSMCDEGILRD